MHDIRALLESEIPHLRRYARALVTNVDEADDLVQSCLQKALENAHQWDSSRRLRPWLFRIQHNIFVSWLRRRETERGIRSAAPRERSVAPRHEVDLHLKEMQRALERLPTEQRTVVLLIALEGLTYQEASEVLAVPVGTIRSRLARGRESLRAALDGGLDTPAAQGGL